MSNLVFRIQDTLIEIEPEIKKIAGGIAGLANVRVTEPNNGNSVTNDYGWIWNNLKKEFYQPLSEFMKCSIEGDCRDVISEYFSALLDKGYIVYT